MEIELISICNDMLSKWVESYKKELPSTFMLSHDSIKKKTERFREDKLMIRSTLNILEDILEGKRYISLKDVKRSKFYPAYPSLHKDIMKDKYYESIQKTIIMVIDTRIHPEKYTTEEMNTIHEKGKECVVQVKEIFNNI